MEEGRQPHGEEVDEGMGEANDEAEEEAETRTLRNGADFNSSIMVSTSVATQGGGTMTLPPHYRQRRRERSNQRRQSYGAEDGTEGEAETGAKGEAEGETESKRSGRPRTISRTGLRAMATQSSWSAAAVTVAALKRVASASRRRSTRSGRVNELRRL